MKVDEQILEELEKINKQLATIDSGKDGRALVEQAIKYGLTFRRWESLYLPLDAALAKSEKEVVGTSIYVRSLTGTLDLYIDDRDTPVVPLFEGMSLECDNPFYRLYFTSAAQTGKAATLLIGKGIRAKDSRLYQREPFIFRPGTAALADGMVASGSRSGGATATTVAANTTVWGTEVVYEPKRAGKIDGRATGGVTWGQLTIGIVASAATPNGKLTARIRNKAGTWTTILTLTSAFALSTSEIFKTYDIPYLLTTTEFNAVPFGIAIGVESDSATNHAIARIMESSYIQGEFEPGT